MKTSPGQRDLFAGFGIPASAKASGWRPSEPPSLAGIDEVALDFETDGVRWWAGDLPVGVAVGWKVGEGQYETRYLPWRHSGGNLPEERVREWFRRELAGRRVANLSTGFEVHMAHAWGEDLEDLGCEVTDVAHSAALLDDFRLRFSLESVSQFYLGEGKLTGLDMRAMRQYHAGDVQAYARQDVLLVLKLRDRFLPMLEEEDLLHVQDLEDQLIFPTASMELLGTPLDVEKLDRWIAYSQEKINSLLREISEEAGFQVNPKKTADLDRLFWKFKIVNPHTTPTGEPSFTDDILSTFDHPTVKKVRLVREYISQRDKFLVPYRRKIDHNGILRYRLNQLKSDEGGTISGRFSSTGSLGEGDEGVNIQQVSKPSKQKLRDLFIRELFVAEAGRLYLAGDAKQIEYRLFGHFARAPKILKAYQEDPETDFHNMVTEMIRPRQPKITRNKAKDTNFALIYGAGDKKAAWMLGISVAEAKELREAYFMEFPEARVLIRKASALAEQRGYVRTLMGRRARFKDGQFSHKALNRIIQGSAADIMKKKLVALYKERKRLDFTMRFTVHDEVDGSVPDANAREEVRKVLDTQDEFPIGPDGDLAKLTVPILWDVKTGQNWKECV